MDLNRSVLNFASLTTSQLSNRTLALNMSLVELLYYISGTETVNSTSLYQREASKQTIRSQLKILMKHQLIEKLPSFNLGGNTHTNVYRCTKAGRKLLKLWPEPLNIPSIYELVKTSNIQPRASTMNLMHMATLAVIGKAKKSGIYSLELADKFSDEPLVSVQRRAQYLVRNGWAVSENKSIGNPGQRSSLLRLTESGTKLFLLVEPKNSTKPIRRDSV